MARKRKHKVGKRKSRKMPPEVLAHFMAKTIALGKKRGIVPKLMTKKKRK